MAKRHIIPLFIPHYGCPQKCVFCDQTKISGQSSPVTPEQVVKEVSESLPQAGFGCELAFYGGSFTALPVPVQEGLLSAVQPFRQTGAVAAIRVSTRPDAIADPICEMLRKYGVTTVELGAQSMVPGVLEQSRRGHTPDDNRTAVHTLHAHGFCVVLQMMTGLPGDTPEGAMFTAREIIRLKPDGVRIYPTVVLRNTELEQRMKTSVYEPHRLEDAIPLCASLYEMFLSAGIPVIRLGLNPSEDLSAGEAVAGAYHPALGEMVLSEMFLHRAEAVLSSAPKSDHAVLLVHPSRVSVMVGQRRRNINALKQEFHLQELYVRSAEADLWEVRCANA